MNSTKRMTPLASDVENRSGGGGAGAGLSAGWGACSRDHIPNALRAGHRICVKLRGRLLW
jgi:hypothetical protein